MIAMEKLPRRWQRRMAIAMTTPIFIVVLLLASFAYIVIELCKALGGLCSDVIKEFEEIAILIIGVWQL